MEINYQLEAQRVAVRYRWSKPFAMAYVLARFVDGLSHASAMRAAARTPGVRARDIPPNV